jgi:hypothetical protein
MKGNPWPWRARLCAYKARRRCTVVAIYATVMVACWLLNEMTR